MAASQRQQRVQEALKEAISEVIRTIKDPRLGFVTLTGVEVAPDLSYARVFFSAYGTEQEQRDSLEALRHASGYIRRGIARLVQLRHTPELEFILDTTPERAERIMQLLHEIELQQAQQGPASSPADDSLDHDPETSSESERGSTASPSPATRSTSSP